MIFKQNFIKWTCLLGLALLPHVALAELKLQLEGESYFSKPSSPIQLKNYTATLIRWKKQGSYKVFDYNVDLLMNTFVDKSRQFYVQVPTAFLSYKYHFTKDWLFDFKHVELSLGRRIYEWSYTDKFWHFGLWNPLDNWKPLTPSESGLVGTFFDLKSDKWSVLLFVGGMYLPTTSPKLQSYTNDLTDTTSLISSSRWSASIPRRISIMDSVLEIDYLVDSPLIFDILLQQSYIFTFKTWSGGPQNYWMKWSISYKPNNLPFFVRNNENALKISEDKGKNPIIAQTITFFPVKHRLISTEWGIDYEKFQAIFSVGDSQIDEAGALPKDWIFVKDRISMTYLSGFLKYSLGKFYGIYQEFELGYIQSWFKKQGDNLSLKKNPAILSDHKVMNGFRLDWRSYFKTGLFKKWDFKVSYWYSIFSQGGLLTVEGDYFFSPRFFVGGGFFVLGSDTEYKSFLNKFRANDYVSWRLGYVF